MARNADRLKGEAAKRKAIVAYCENALMKIAEEEGDLEPNERRGAVDSVRSVLEKQVIGDRTRTILPRLASVVEETLRSLDGRVWPDLRYELAAVRDRIKKHVGPDFGFRALIVANFDRPDFLGLRRPPTDRELAIISVLAGTLPNEREADKQMSVAELMRLEEKAMKAARRRIQRPGVHGAVDAEGSRKQYAAATKRQKSKRARLGMNRPRPALAPSDIEVVLPVLPDE